jgi:membrane associated rhomboid family serine protease
LARTPHTPAGGESPFNALPPAVVALAALIGGLEAMFQLAGMGLLGGVAPDGQAWRLAAARDWGVSDAVWEWMRLNGRWPPELLARFVTYPLIHGAFTHAAFVTVFVLAIGNAIGGAFGGWRLFALFWASAAGGALLYVVALDAQGLLIGGFPGVYGLIGGFTFLLYVGAARVGANRLTAFRLIAVLLGIQLVVGLLFGANRDWLADAGGFATGFALAPVLVPGGFARLLDRLRRR